MSEKNEIVLKTPCYKKRQVPPARNSVLMLCAKDVPARVALLKLDVNHLVGIHHVVEVAVGAAIRMVSDDFPWLGSSNLPTYGQDLGRF